MSMQGGNRIRRKGLSLPTHEILVFVDDSVVLMALADGTQSTISTYELHDKWELVE